MSLRAVTAVAALALVVSAVGAAAMIRAGGDAAMAGMLSILATLLVTALALLRLQRAAHAWLNRASEFATAVASGELQARVPKTRLRDFDQLGRQMNQMAATLQETTERLRRQAYHDTLTGLPNRGQFMARAKEILSAAPLPGSVAVLFLDLDRFKLLNDTAGHAAGDTLLQVVADRLQAVAGTGALVARLGGDEFTLLIHSRRAESAAAGIAERIVENLRRPFRVGGHSVFVTASIGISCNEEGDETVTELMRKADVALYRAKAAGKARYAVFDTALDAVSVEQLHLDSDLRTAVERNELTLRYQPEVDLRSGRLIGMEALVRWNHPRRGVLPPSTFIAMAEETGEILHIGSWVLEHACREAVELGLRSPSGRDLVVAVNLSPSEFQEAGLVAEVARILEQTGLPPQRLKLEVTESVFIEDLQHASYVLRSLQGLGVRLAIDDFGTGYSSLSYLQVLPVDTLKIDQSFVKLIGASRRSDAILRTVIDLGAALDMHVVAEGIESQAQFEFLRTAECAAGQGFLFSAPLTGDEFGELLERMDVQRAGLKLMRREA
ncbi:MAG: EAL domain-containing protein [Dehalococcoidia bacterium]|nr:EAL domain-containing protein [Dehalococcoidia bacterium]